MLLCLILVTCFYLISFKTSIEPFPFLGIIPCLDKLLCFLNLKQKRTMQAWFLSDAASMWHAEVFWCTKAAVLSHSAVKLLWNLKYLHKDISFTLFLLVKFYVWSLMVVQRLLPPPPPPQKKKKPLPQNQNKTNQPPTNQPPPPKKALRTKRECTEWSLKLSRFDFRRNGYKEMRLIPK